MIGSGRPRFDAFASGWCRLGFGASLSRWDRRFGIQADGEPAFDRIDHGLAQRVEAFARDRTDEHARNASPGSEFDVIAQDARTLRDLEPVELIEDKQLL